MNQDLCFPTYTILQMGYTMRACNGMVVVNPCVEVFDPLVKVDRVTIEILKFQRWKFDWMFEIKISSILCYITVQVHWANMLIDSG